MNTPNFTFQYYISLYSHRFFIYLTVFLIGFICTPNLNAQGLIFDDNQYKKVPLIKVSKQKSKSIDDNYSLVKYAPIPGVQGKISSCVGWSIANALTIYKAYRGNNQHKGNITENMFSPAFIYNNLIQKNNRDCQSGVLILEGLQLLKESGVCLKKTFDYAKGVSCTQPPSSPAIQEAAGNKLTTTYQKVFQDNKDKVSNTKYQIAMGNPVIAGFKCIPLDRELRSQSTWHPDRQSNNRMGHAMVVVAYDNVTFTLMNSYGTSWGKKGFIKISHEDYKTYAKVAYVLDFKLISKSLSSPQVTESEVTVEMEGKVRLSYSEENQAPYKDLNLQFSAEEQVYKIIDAKQIEGKYLKFEIDIPTGLNAYLFNMDTKGNIAKLWQMEAADKDSTIVLPANSYDSYQLEVNTKEYLGIIFSYEILKDYDSKIEQLPLQEHSNLVKAINTIWKGKVISEATQYTTNSPKFYAKAAYSEGVMVPIIISIDNAN